MTQALVPYEAQLPAAQEWESMYKLAASIAKTDLVPKALDTPEKVIAVVLTGRELGLGFMTSVRALNIIGGRVEMSTQLMLALAKRTGELEEAKLTSSSTSASFRVKRRGQEPYTTTFSTEDAKRAGLLDKPGPWKADPAVMLQWRAISRNLRVTFPDVLLGVYSPGELSEVEIETHINTETGEILPSAHPEPPEPTHERPTPPPEGINTSLANLIAACESATDLAALEEITLMADDMDIKGELRYKLNKAQEKAKARLQQPQPSLGV